MRVGVFGGTFNPIHLGHVRSAEKVRGALGLDRVYFVPSSIPPHKNRGIAAAKHRYKMVEIAIKEEPAFYPSRIELDRAGPSYSIDTIRYFVSIKEVTSVAFLIGIDAFVAIESWKSYAEVPSLCDLIVTSRPGVPIPPKGELIPVALRAAFCYDSATQTYIHQSGHTLTLHRLEGLNISASAIRANVNALRPLHGQVTPAVGAYIEAHSLYRRNEEISVEG